MTHISRVNEKSSNPRAVGTSSLCRPLLQITTDPVVVVGLFLAPIRVIAMSTTTTTAAANEPAHVGALIFLHGLGGSPAGWKGLQRALPQYRPRLNQIKYVFPSAPTIPISINGEREMRVSGQHFVPLLICPFACCVRCQRSAGMKRECYVMCDHGTTLT